MHKNNNQWWIINTILLIIIIIILLSRCNKNNNYKTSADIYNIEFEEQDKCKLKNENGDIVITDDNGDYLYQKKLDIFSNSVFKNKIAPGVSDTYNFKVQNKTNKDIKYFIMMNGISNYYINLKYRLKKNDIYIVGDNFNWVTEQELNTSYNKLHHGKSDNYSLEWKWFDNDETDNFAGKGYDSDYLLNISFYLEKNDNI